MSRDVWRDVAGGIGDEGVVEVGGLREIEQFLEEAVEVAGVEEVFPADDVGVGLMGVIDDDSEVVGGANVAAGEDGIAEEVGIDVAGAVVEIVKGEGTGEGGGLGGIESPGGFFFGQKVGFFGGAELLAGAGVVESLRSVGGVGEVGELGFDLAPGAKAGVEDVEGFELIEGVVISGDPIELAEGGLGPTRCQASGGRTR